MGVCRPQQRRERAWVAQDLFFLSRQLFQQPKAITEFGTYTEEPCLTAGTGGAAIDGALAAAKPNFLVCS